MSDYSPPLMLDLPCDDALDWLNARLSLADLSVVRTFDLQVARHAQSVCPCPHHGTEQCDCQMVVLLVYQAGHCPVTLVAHGFNRQTWFSVVNTPQQRADPDLEAAIRSSFTPPTPRNLGLLNARIFPDQV